MNAKKVQIEHLTQELDSLQKQNNDLHNQLMTQRNDLGTHIHPESILNSVKKRNSNTGSQSDARFVVDEICQILCLEDNDPVNLLETIRKLEKVVKAVPRMEGFIHNLSLTMAD